MNELERIVREVARLEGATYLLATVVRVSGSSYRRPGARMLVAGERWVAGCVSGGCLEGDVMVRGAHRCRDGPVVVTYDSSAEDSEAWRVGLGCDGIVDVLLEHVPAGAEHDALAFARACFAANRTGTLVTVIESAHAATPVGARLAIGPTCELARPVTDAAARRALEAAAAGPLGVVRIAELGLGALVEEIAPSPELFVLGSGHDAAPVVALATSIGMRVTVADRAIREPSRFLAAHRAVSHAGSRDKLAALIGGALEPYVVIMHHQRDADRDAIAVALASRARYIGVLGPARRTHELLAELGRRPGDDPRLHAPAGLDVGAETPEQIALAIVGELSAVARRRPAVKLRDRARALHADLAIAVLAAGGSRRLGRPKQLVDAGGEPLIRRIARTCVDAGLGPVAVVVGAHADDVGAALGDLRVTRVANPAWEEGIGSSIRAAVAWAETAGAAALAIVLGDQPLLAPDHLAALRDAWLGGAALVGSRYAGTLGAPAIFDRARFAELASCEGDRGAGALLRAAGAVAVDWPGGAVDVDTEDDVPVRSLPVRSQ
jgi:xanthine/CO dehydrogenase XdhC/CoxF family maturation factor/CTP:molybdopterin cytidylyltransferase MocA